MPMYVYFVTNSNRTTLYVGVTNDLSRRLVEHFEGGPVNNGFSGTYKTHHLIYFEEYEDPNVAIAREKQVKKWGREKKEKLIATENPTWRFLELEI